MICNVCETFFVNVGMIAAFLLKSRNINLNLGKTKTGEWYRLQRLNFKQYLMLRYLFTCLYSQIFFLSTPENRISLNANVFSK